MTGFAAWTSRFMSMAAKGARRAKLAARHVANRALSIVGHDDYVRFIILTRSRTGSNLLVSFLNGHPNIYSEGEIFARMNGQDPVARLDAAFGRQPKHVRAKGFKIFYYHPLDAPGSELWTRLESDFDLRVIHLTRRNILRTLVSRKIAGVQDTWTATRFDAPQVESRRVGFSVSELEAGFRETRLWEESADKRFATHPLLHISYEDLVGDPGAAYRRLLQFLDASARPPSTGLRRQNPEKLHALVENYDELKRAFAGTRWQDFFDD
jgi:LPS sulfotransferase NodH